MFKHLPLLTVLTIVILAALLVLIYGKPAADRSIETQNQKMLPPKIALTIVASGLGNPTAIVSTNVRSDKRLFVVDRSGVIRIVEGSQIIPNAFLDISGKVLARGEMGLLGLAFHPDFAENGYFFVNYIDSERNTIVSRFKISADKNQADGQSEKILLQVAQPYENHNGGDLAFGADDLLYIGLGDGGAGGDPEDRAQNLNELLGKILRIDVNSQEAYEIPEDNPFVSNANARAEVWSYGLRNPWRFSFDSESGSLFIADVGQGEMEEINFEKTGSKGANYGWRCFEGSRDFNTLGCRDSSQYTLPILEYDHSENRCSVTGGYAYRGKKYPALVGKYFYGDYCGGQLYLAEEKDGKWGSQLAFPTNFKISTFGQDSEGEIYLADFETGNIYQIHDVAN